MTTDQQWGCLSYCQGTGSCSSISTYKLYSYQKSRNHNERLVPVHTKWTLPQDPQSDSERPFLNCTAALRVPLIIFSYPVIFYCFSFKTESFIKHLFFIKCMLKEVKASTKSDLSVHLTFWKTNLKNVLKRIWPLKHWSSRYDYLTLLCISETIMKLHL